MACKNPSIPATAIALLVMTLVGQCYGQLQAGYYNGKCGQIDVEGLVFRVVKAIYIRNPLIVGGLVRMTFHDCFVRGCDASVLLDGPNTEKTAFPNLSLVGFEIIDAIKDTVEKFCPEVVSCADIIAIAGRVVVFLAGGKWYNVETGRRDGRISIAQEANENLPSPRIPVPVAIDLFARWGLDVEDFVLLLGAHTVGFARCSSFQDRLYNHRNTGHSDSSMSPALVQLLRRRCPRNPRFDNAVFLDQTPGSGLVFDNGFFKAIRAHKGVLQIDQDLALDFRTKDIVKTFANTQEFLSKFGKAMVKMGRIGVLTGNQGEVRKHCRLVN
ncbi:hypothetical protein Cgig2_000891 [Carnegiea gigantea]|uniref:Peroxidase n=1 Tax=Carnegiea gigantea TaxID=171969 RepID=A0A9Q1JLI0_9CARY|nr:hypothetical protein Cgig2_000891 [Carnegiea gigantea]